MLCVGLRGCTSTFPARASTRFWERTAHGFGRDRVHHLQGHQLGRQQLQRPARASGQRRRTGQPGSPRPAWTGAACVAGPPPCPPGPGPGVPGTRSWRPRPRLPPCVRRSRPVPPAPGRRAARSGPGVGAAPWASRRQPAASSMFVPRGSVPPGSACGIWGLSATREDEDRGRHLHRWATHPCCILNFNQVGPLVTTPVGYGADRSGIGHPVAGRVRCKSIQRKYICVYTAN